MGEEKQIMESNKKKKLEVENKLKIEDRRRISEEKEIQKENKKKSILLENKPKAGDHEKNITVEDNQIKHTELQNRIKCEDMQRTNEERELLATNGEKGGEIVKKTKEEEIERKKEENTLKDGNKKRITKLQKTKASAKNIICNNFPEIKNVNSNETKTLNNKNELHTPVKETGTDDSQKLVILAKKSPPKQKTHKNGLRQTISKKAQEKPTPKMESENKMESPTKVGLQRRNSVQKHKEQWV